MKVKTVNMKVKVKVGTAGLQIGIIYKLLKVKVEVKTVKVDMKGEHQACKL